MEYSSIGRQITLKADLSSLSKRDKISLLCDLMRELGITEKITPELNKVFQEAFKG